MQRSVFANALVRPFRAHFLMAAMLFEPAILPRMGDLAPPTPPVFTSLEAGEPGCALAVWTSSGDPTVVGYVVDYGTRSVHGGTASTYEHSMEVGVTGSATVCFLPAGTNYVALRSKNLVGMLSGYSVERSVSIAPGSAVIARFEARIEPEGVRLQWRVEADDTVRGFRLYRSAAGEMQRVLTDLPPSVTTFTDTDAQPGVAYTYVLAAVKRDGNEVRSIPVVVAVTSLSLDLELLFYPRTGIGFTRPDTAPAFAAIRSDVSATTWPAR